MKKTSSVRSIVFALLLFVLAFSLTACSKNSDNDGIPPHIHSYGDYKYSNDYHWKECSCGERTVSETHSLNGNTCTVCGYKKSEETPIEHKHSYGEYKHNTTSHWKECSCGERTVSEAHSFNGNTCSVCSYEKPDTTVKVISVSLNKTQILLEIKETETLIATITPDNATNRTVVWKSSNDSIVSVDNGTVTAIAAGTATVTASADGKSATCSVTVVKQDFKFVEYRTGYSVAGYNGTDSTVSVPSTYNDKQVIAIGTSNNDGFCYTTNIEKIVLPNSIREINDNAFAYCSDLKTITIPNCVRIGDGAFLGCSALTELSIPETCVTIGTNIVKDCTH